MIYIISLSPFTCNTFVILVINTIAIVLISFRIFGFSVLWVSSMSISLCVGLTGNRGSCSPCKDKKETLKIYKFREFHILNSLSGLTKSQKLTITKLPSHRSGFYLVIIPVV